MKVVLDTNLRVSGIFYSGAPSTIVSAWIDDQFDLVVSTEIVEEYRSVAERIALKVPGIELDRVLDRIALHALLVLPTKLPGDACTDRDDIKFLECAVASRADCIISGDRALLRASGYEGILVVTPRRFVDQILST